MHTITTQSLNGFVSKIMDHALDILGPKKLHRFVSLNLKASFLVGLVALLVFILFPQSRAWFNGYLTILFWLIVIYMILRVVSAVGFALCYYLTREETETKSQKELWINIMALIAVFELILYGFVLMKRQS